MMSSKIQYIAVALICLLTACQKQQPDVRFKQTGSSVQYANLLEMQDLEDDAILCRIRNPWQQERVAMQYLLVNTESGKDTETSILDDKKVKSLEEKYGPFQVLNVPLDKQTVTSSCHLWLLDQLKALETVNVVCDADYVMIPSVQEALINGTIADGGSSMAPNTEVIKAAGCSCIWVSPFESTSQLVVSAQLPDLPVIYCADYMESSPLARAEWMRFYGRLVGKSYEADSLFHEVSQSYNALVVSDSISELRPTLLAELPFGATWYVPGGRSTLGLLYQDAGFQYPWSSDTHGGSLSLSPEAVFERGCKADIWIFKQHDAEQSRFSRTWFLAQNVLFSQFEAVEKGQVYGCNTARSDYFDSTPFRPDLLLKELRFLREGKEDSLVYFVKLKE